LSALTMPVVTVFCSPPGEPIATTSWPTTSLLESPSVAAVRPLAFWAWTTAMSALVSAPTTLAWYFLPSDVVITTFWAPSTTCALVRIRPSEVRMTPEPMASPCPVVTLIWTTLGVTFAATPLTSPEVEFDTVCPVAAGVLTDVVAPSAEFVVSPTIAAPPTPPTSAAPRAVALTIIATRPPLRGLAFSAVGICCGGGCGVNRGFGAAWCW
jgi:hypothetical protein